MPVGLQVSVLVVLLIGLAGAALGYWLVRKFVISEDGSVDVGVAQFVKWAMRIVGFTCVFQVIYLCILFFNIVVVNTLDMM